MSVRSGAYSVRSPSEFSMGETMARGGAYMSVGSATFNSVSARLTQRVREEVAEELKRRDEALAIVVPYGVNADAMAALQKRYPEFTLHSVPIWNGVHSALEAERMVASALCLTKLSHYTRSVVTLGNAMLPAAQLRMRDVHMEMSAHYAYGVHANHTSQWIYQRMAAQSSNIQREYNYTFDAALFRDFLRGRVLSVCDDPQHTVQAEGFFVDLSMYPMSVHQACSAFAASGCSVGEVMIPYVPDMLVHVRGEWHTTGVEYELTQDNLLLKYPEGVAGATRFPLGAWVEWLKSNSTSVVVDGDEFHYQVELTSVRGPYLFASITKLAVPTPKSALAFSTHALDLPVDRERYFVRTFRLKGLHCDPTLRSSYETYCYMPDKRMVDKVFAHAMSLPKESFKDGSVLKRVTVLDGRVTFSGMSVSVDRPVAMEEVAQMTQDVVLRAFVARYNMGELGADLMEQLNSVRGFASASVATKVAYLTCALAKCAWNWTIGALAKALRDVVQLGLKLITGRGHRELPEFSPAPTFVLFQSYAHWLSGHVYSRIPEGTGGTILVPYVRGAVESYRAANRYVPPRRPMVPVVLPPEVNVASHGLNDDIVDTRAGGPVSQAGKDLVSALKELNGVTQSPADRFDLPMTTIVEQGPYEFGPEDFIYDDGYIQTINDEHERTFPGMALQKWEADFISLHYDPQNRNLAADYMHFPSVGPANPRRVTVFKSKCNTYRVERKMQTLQQLILALDARNLSAPQIAVPQNIDAVIHDTWENFLDMCCVEGARDMIANYQRDRVGFEQEALEEWTQKAKPQKVQQMLDALAKEALSVEQFNIEDFDVMVKSDAKPPLSTKPINEQLAPQVIVYHKPLLSAMFSSIFRVLARRFTALLKPNWMVNLLKDMDAVRQVFTAYYPWGGEPPKFLENDYSKYDKSQAEMCVRLEQFVNDKLGFDPELAARWYKGHERSRIRSVQHGLTLFINWQRRSGGGNTAFGNVVVNILTTAYVYRGSDVLAAAYIGDDSLIMCRRVSANSRSVETLGNVFNLQAKFLVTNYPYFASNFIIFDHDQRQALAVPDPFKRAQRIGLSVNAVEPNWEDRLRSHRENCQYYRYRKVQRLLVPSLSARYELSPAADPYALLNALATSGDSNANARGCWEEEPTVVEL
ncbi:RNA-dependent RNA polymerase [Aspergillus fumigatus RNA virus 1]|uniref:RNA-dependent RNA polymerase n=1 Tax=Aspergillus fumigatus RNA virus 1 TaxID=2747487 RepID=A0AC59HJG6_9VIRU|nr:RNA-dependent RNA polymerase [Aspergillus fumigatus RNA virus 1]